MSRRVSKKRPAVAGKGRLIIGAAAAIGLVIVLVVLISGCGASHKSPEAVVKALISAYDKGKAAGVYDCYGQKKDPEDALKVETEAKLAFLNALGKQKIEPGNVEKIGEIKDVTILCVRYGVVLEDEDIYPCIATYAVHPVEEKYYIMSPSEITEEIASASAEAYMKYMTTESYKDYVREYNTFNKKKPGFEDTLAERLEV